MEPKKLFLGLLVLYIKAGISSAGRGSGGSSGSSGGGGGGGGGGGDVSIHISLAIPPIPAVTLALRTILLALISTPTFNLFKIFRASSMPKSSPFFTLSLAVFSVALAQILAIAFIAANAAVPWIDGGLGCASVFFTGFLEIPMSLAIIHFVASRYSTLSNKYGTCDPHEKKRRVAQYGFIGGILAFDLALIGVSVNPKAEVYEVSISGNHFTYFSYTKWERTIMALKYTSLACYVILSLLVIYSMYRLHKLFRASTMPPVDQLVSFLFKRVLPLLVACMTWRIIATVVVSRFVGFDIVALLGVIFLEYPFLAIIHMAARIGLSLQAIAGAELQAQNEIGQTRDS
ncbi:hypothetical protein AX16_010743 [Volvariella volvacea WC 439]|nr:hypothetical protein AX16_010743 [Volvariella volvacea WC 439]